MKAIKIIGLAVVVPVMIDGFYWWWRHGKTFPSTDDATLEANVLAIAPQIGGRVVAVLAVENGYVAAGDLLFSIDPAAFRAAVDVAQAELDRATLAAGSAGAEVSGPAAAFPMVFTGAVLMNRFDPRAQLAPGLLLTGFGNLTLGWLNLNAGFWDLALPGVVSGLGMALFFVPMSTSAFQNIGPDRQGEASGIYGVMRSLGSSVGIAIVGWLVASRSQFHWSVLSEPLTPFDPEVTAYLRPLGLTAQSPQGAEMMAGLVSAQASMLAFQDAFWLTGWTAFLMLPGVLILQRPVEGARAPAGAHSDGTECPTLSLHPCSKGDHDAPDP